MTKVNKYVNGAHISERKFRLLLKLFSEDLTSVQISRISGISRVTVNKYVRAIRLRIYELCERESPFSGPVEVDESYFGARRVKGKRGRGAHGKTIVFGIYKRNGKVYTQIVPDVTRSSLLSVIQCKVTSDSEIHSDSWRAYDGLVDLGYKKHYRVNHTIDEFVRGTNHINGIEGFWGLAKTRLAKFKGIHRSTILLHLKECEFRYNYRRDNIYKLLLKSFLISKLKLS